MTLKFQFAHAIKKGFNVVFTEMADPRTSSYFLIPNPFPLGCIMLAYVLFVVVIGPKVMEGQRPSTLRRWYVLYNLLAVLFNLRMTYKGARYWFFEYDSMCGPLERSKSDLSMELTHYVYIHFVLKLLELLHTVMLILSKRNHSTYTHILKHSILIGLSWSCVKYYPGSHCIFLAFIDSAINLIVHLIFLLIDGSEFFDQYWTWKKRIVSIKLVHYQIIVLHLLEQYVYGCDYSKFHLFFIIPLSYFVTNAFVNYDHEDKIDELFRLYKEEPAPKKYKFQ